MHVGNQGKEEAGLAWIAANYLHGTFGEESSSSPSLGIIEMGGGSTQATCKKHVNTELAHCRWKEVMVASLTGRF